jgi:hypothetical protein
MTLFFLEKGQYWGMRVQNASEIEIFKKDWLEEVISQTYYIYIECMLVYILSV